MVEAKLHKYETLETYLGKQIYERHSEEGRVSTDLKPRFRKTYCRSCVKRFI